MNDVIILGTDTDAGKTTLALLWLTAFADQYDYWKPIETGPSDSTTLANLVPSARIYPPVCRLGPSVAPPLAARWENTTIPTANALASARPASDKHLLVETFGSPFSPLNETELQIDLVHALNMPAVLVGPSTLGAIGRTLQCLEALHSHGLFPRAVVLLGAVDEFAIEKISQYGGQIELFSLQPPSAWTTPALQEAVDQQQDKLHDLRHAFLPLPKTHADLIERDRAAVWHPYTSLRDPDPPLVCTGVQDEFLFLADGQRVIDGISSWWTILHGHRFPPLMNALREAQARFDHVHFAGVTHAPGVELAELLLADMPWQGGRVFYSDNGSTAVEVALKMAYQFWCHQGEPQRLRFIGFEHGYHGDTFGAMAVSRDPVFFGRFEPLLLQADILPLDPDRLDEHLTRHAQQVAGVILEPLVQGAGGMRMHSPELLKQIFEVTRAHDVLFLADEVMTGGGRTGSPWAYQAAGIAPDLICAGKTLTGGVLPLAATLVSPRVVQAFHTEEKSKTFFHGHSFTAHPLACSVAVANWKLLRHSPTNLAQEIEKFWQATLLPMRNMPKVREVRIQGSIAVVELDCPGGYLAQAARHLRTACLAEGVLLRPLGNVLYALPPLRTAQSSLEKIVQAMTHALQTCP
jgi:adenosylmethionine-8-amino-7-oxononanoate aminotransferase